MVLDFSVQRTILPISRWDLMALGPALALGFSSFGGIVYRRTLFNMVGLVGLLALWLEFLSGPTMGPF